MPQKKVEHRIELSDGSPCTIIMSEKTHTRLKDLCFRSYIPLAGNLRRWKNFREMVMDGLFMKKFLEDILEMLEDNGEEYRWRKEFLQRRTTLEFDEPIGWTSTVHLSELEIEKDFLETFHPNPRSTAFRMRSKTVQAPLTQDVTMSYTLIYRPRRGWEVTVRSLYPGPDIGRLEGDFRKLGIVFFDWNHPGEK